MNEGIKKMIDSPYVAKRVQTGIPLWDIKVRGVDVGVLTDLPMEGSPMATIRYNCDEVEFAADTIRGVLAQVGDYLREVDAEVAEAAAIYEMEHYAEVIGPMEAAERRAESMGWGRDEDPVW